MSIVLKKDFRILETLHDIDATEFEIQFRITDACNLNCEYCAWNNGPQYATKDILECIDVLQKFIKKINKSVTFYFHGGEPSTHKDLDLICKTIKAKIPEAIIEVQTNLVKDISTIKEIDYFSISFHYNELIRTNHLDLFIENFKKINPKIINNLDIMLENVDDSEKYYKIIKSLIKNSNTSEMIYGYYGGYTSVHMDFYNKNNKNVQKFIIDGNIYNTNDLFSKGLDCRGSKCYSPKSQLYINGNGDAYKCATHLTEDSTNPYINILKEPEKFIKSSRFINIPVTCNWSNCIDFFVERHI